MAKDVGIVAKNVIKSFDSIIYPKAIRIFTPFTQRVPVSSCDLDRTINKLLVKYEPKIKTNGLFPHQAEFLKAYFEEGYENFIITSGTGSGKSLCFWIWIFDHMIRDSNANAILCFPTQALMWGQAERLVRLSEPDSLIFPDGDDTICYGGTIKVGNKSLPWTIWHGVGWGSTRDEKMADHEGSEFFKAARIRIATLDKANWSLIEKHKDFLRHLRCIVLDEAHMYDGVFGANVHYFLERVYLSCEVLGESKPNLFLASATLSSAEDFAKMLLSVEDGEDLKHIKDTTNQEIELIPISNASDELIHPRTDGLLRMVLLLDCENVKVDIPKFMSSKNGLGDNVNAIYFSQSKYRSKRLKLRLMKENKVRDAVIYDADLPPKRRREIEKLLNNNRDKGITLIGTSALELGVDIEGLDVCIIQEIPPSQADMLQRMGRVGRRVDSPGLVIMCLSSEPRDRSILDAPQDAFKLDLTKTIPIPLHLEMVKWRHMLAAFIEWMAALKKGDASWTDFNNALKKYFGEAPKYSDLKERFEERYGSLVDTSERAWVHKGFRASASEGKVVLKENGTEVARIDDIAIFRDAHPEAVYLGHDLKRYRVVGYEGQWKIAEWEHQDSDVILGKWLKTIKTVELKQEKRNIITRGLWDENFDLYKSSMNFVDHLKLPKKGILEFGIWTYNRRFQGYKEIDLSDEERTRTVSLDEVKQRFKEAKDRGENPPFLFDFSYRTLGWQWRFKSIKIEKNDENDQRSLGRLTCSILEHFLADAVESRITDLQIGLDLEDSTLQVLDSTPGGNGLSEALLAEDRMQSALQKCEKRLSKFRGKADNQKFKKFVLDLCRDEPQHSANEVENVIKWLYANWSR
ncbi:MAG TPA: DEAD/DEAH box helicase [Methanothrix sp.]|nr:DEAD/DEAH box helicase [Methanothrix sp.]